MKLPTLRQTTEQKLAAAHAARAAAEQRIVALENERRAALESDEIEGLHKLHAAIAQQKTVIADLAERIVILDERKRREDAEQRGRKHWLEVEKFEATLPNRLKAAVRVVETVSAVSAAVREFEVANAACRRAWPAGSIRWGLFHLDGARVGALLEEAFSPGGLVRRRGSMIIGPPANIEYADKAATADERSSGFVEQERRHQAQLMADLREQGVPQPDPPADDDEPPQDEQEVAA